MWGLCLPWPHPVSPLAGHPGQLALRSSSTLMVSPRPLIHNPVSSLDPELLSWLPGEGGSFQDSVCWGGGLGQWERNSPRHSLCLDSSLLAKWVHGGPRLLAVCLEGAGAICLGAGLMLSHSQQIPVNKIRDKGARAQLGARGQGWRLRPWSWGWGWA